MRRLRFDLRLAAAACLAAVVATSVVVDAGAQVQAPPTTDARAIVATMRATRDGFTTDATLRLMANGPGGFRSVLPLRVRARTFGPLFKTLVEVRDPSSLEGRFLLVHDGTSLAVTAWRRDGAASAATRTIAPCLFADDLVELHFWWPDQVLERTEVTSGRLSYVITSRPASAGTGLFTRVTTWVDAERMAPVRAEKVGHAEDGSVLTTYDRWRRRDGRWLPGRVTLVRLGSGCRAVLTALRGTTRANVPANIFDPTGLTPVVR